MEDGVQVLRASFRQESYDTGVITVVLKEISFSTDVTVYCKFSSSNNATLIIVITV